MWVWVGGRHPAAGGRAAAVGLAIPPLRVWSALSVVEPMWRNKTGGGAAYQARGIYADRGGFRDSVL